MVTSEQGLILIIFSILFTVIIAWFLLSKEFKEREKKQKEIAKKLKIQEEKEKVMIKQEEKPKEESRGEKMKKIEFEIPGTFSKKTLEFSGSFVEYRSKRIYYKNVTGLSYHSIRNYVNFVPTGDHYYIVIEDDYNTIDINFSSSFLFIGNKERKDLFSQIVYISEKFIKPFLLLNLINQFSQDGYIKIASLTITADNIRRERFLMGPVFLPLKEYGSYEIMQGNLMIYGKGNKHFCSVPLSRINTVALPEIIYFIREKNAISEVEKKKEEKKKEYNINFCSSCGSLIKEGANFCVQCGRKIK